MEDYLAQLKNEAVLIPGEMVTLRSISKADLPTIRKWLKDLSLVRLAFGVEADNKVLEKLGNDYYQEIVQHAEYAFGIEDREGALIGFLRFVPRIDKGSAKIGILIGEKHRWNRGYGTDAVELLLKLLFEILGFEKVELDTAEFNTRAQRCFEKAGFRRVGEESDLDLLKGSYSHRVYMEINREEYLAARPDSI